MPFDEAARQRATIYAHFLHPVSRLDWDIVIARHKAISYNAERGAIR